MLSVDTFHRCYWLNRKCVDHVTICVDHVTICVDHVTICVDHTLVIIRCVPETIYSTTWQPYPIDMDYPMVTHHTDPTWSSITLTKWSLITTHMVTHHYPHGHSSLPTWSLITTHMVTHCLSSQCRCPLLFNQLDHTLPKLVQITPRPIVHSHIFAFQLASWTQRRLQKYQGRTTNPPIRLVHVDTA